MHNSSLYILPKAMCTPSTADSIQDTALGASFALCISDFQTYEMTATAQRTYSYINTVLDTMKFHLILTFKQTKRMLKTPLEFHEV